MVNRICISINNRCNLRCKYCHFNEKHIDIKEEMNIYTILDNVIEYAKNEKFKIGFVGNGEPLLDIVQLKNYISHLEKYPNISCYTVTNGTIDLTDEDILFFVKHNVNVGFSLDGYRELHNKNRCNTFDKVIKNINHYKNIAGYYPTLNATVGIEMIMEAEKVIEFFKEFNVRITFSRMIGKYGISLKEYIKFITVAEKELEIRKGDLDCTMYGGRCGAGLNNFFYANGYVYYCGNCIDMNPIGKYDIKINELEDNSICFDRTKCYKENK